MFSEEEKVKVQAWINEGITGAKIAKKLNLTYGMYRLRLQASGIKTPEHGNKGKANRKPSINKQQLPLQGILNDTPTNQVPNIEIPSKLMMEPTNTVLLHQMNSYLEEQLKKTKKELESVELDNKKLRAENLDSEIKLKTYDAQKKLEIDQLTFQLQTSQKSGLSGIIDKASENPEILLGVINMVNNLLTKNQTAALPQNNQQSFSDDPAKNMVYQTFIAMLNPLPMEKLGQFLEITNAIIQDTNSQFFNNLYNQVVTNGTNNNPTAN